MNALHKNDLAAGVDIGGSHITVALINLTNRSILENTWCREPVNAGGSAEEIINTWVSVIHKCFSKAAISPGLIGIAMPGPFDYDLGISYMKDQGKFRELYGMNVRELIAAKLGISKEAILFNNDASCFLQGELFTGTGKGYNQVIGLTLGTGFGSAIASDGIVTDAEFWCAPFKNGIAEDHLSGRSLVHTYTTISGKTVDQAKQLFENAEQDEYARQAFIQFGNDMAEFLNGVTQNKSPELIIFGGSISNAFELFAPAVKQNLADPTILLAHSTLGENAALIGAASMWFRDVKKKQFLSAT